MKYSELIQFDPIENVIQLTDSNDTTKAVSLVKSYVMSDGMADNINRTILTQLKLDDAIDSKGVLLVGNYGTGKSHLMSVISAVAIDKDNIKHLHNTKFADYTQTIAGRFETIRIEIGAVTTPLREIIFSNVKHDLMERGIEFNYPEISGPTNNKDTLLDMMRLFGEKYSDKGYLIVVDEVLDFLRGKDEQAIRLDLGFMRELGEVAKSSRLRTIFGLQEKLFDNPSFQFVADRINQMRDRYEQAIIRKEDTTYVVTERILKKTKNQKAIIREHLQKYCSLYSNMSERIEEFVSLYPIHPSFIDVFNKVYIAENRHILANISTIVKGILGNDFSNNEPGVISFDNYWTFIKNNMSFRSDPNINEVVEKSGQLEAIIKRSMTKEIYKAPAVKMINALSVHRLTTGDIQLRAGLTSENLRDDLCVYIKDLPDNSSDTLQTFVQSTLKEVITTVSGQFIDYDKDNGQYFLDLKKDIDYDEKITQRAATISEDSLNSHFFDVIYSCLDWDVSEYVASFKIYEHTLNWYSNNIFRRGYLFLGKPEDRSTAQPPEDYYIYFLPPYGNVDYTDDKKKDEVFFVFKDDDEFKNNLRLYAASIMQKGQADEKNKQAYQGKADSFKKRLLNYLSENKNTCFELIYCGVKKKPVEVLSGKYKSDRPFKETIDLVASIVFDDWFKEKYPQYPVFKTQVTKNNQAATVKAAFDYFAGRKEQLGSAMLDSFNLLSGDSITIKNSKWAGYYASQLDKLPAGSVTNFSDIYEEVYSSIEKIDKEFKLSYILLPIVLLALVHTGRAVITLRNGTVLSASNLDTIPRIGTTDIYEFKHISKPKGLQLPELMHLFEVLGLPEGLIRDENSREVGLEKLLTKAQEIVHKTARAESRLNSDFELWGEPMIASHVAEEYKKSAKSIHDILGNFNTRFNTVPKLNNFTYSMDEISNLAKDIKTVEIVMQYDDFKNLCKDNVNYARNIENVEEVKSLIEDVRIEYRKVRDSIADGKMGESAAGEVDKIIEKAKKTYTDIYFKEHNKRRLTHADYTKKTKVMDSAAYDKLKRLSEIDEVLATSKLNNIMTDISGLKVCYDLTPETMKSSHICTSCGFQLNGNDPLVEGKVNDLEERINKLLCEWAVTLHNAITDPLTSSQKKFLTKEQQKVIDNFEKDDKLPDVVDQFFVNTVKDLLKGFETVTLESTELIDELTALGACDADTFKKKIESIIESVSKGKDKEKLRIIIR